MLNRHLGICMLAGSLILAVILPQPAAAGTPSGKVFTIDISGNVDPGMAAFVRRSLENAANEPNSLVVLEMDTFGGRVDSALEIVDALLNVSHTETVAYVKNKAISAGALIALACNQMLMKPNTTIGDCAPIIYSNEGPKMMGEKFQSPLRAKFRALARKNGYSEALAESMVTADMVVYRVAMEGKTVYMDGNTYDDLTDEEKKAVESKKTVVAKGELLTMDDVEAHEYGFSKGSTGSIREMLDIIEFNPTEIVKIEESWSETLVRFIGTIAPILMIIGLGALYTEMKAPGFGAPGIIGIIFLSLVFFHQYLVGLADHTELLIILLGLVLLGVEIFVIPGFGIAGFSGLFCILVGMVLAFQDFVIPDPNLPWQFDLLMTNITMVLGSFAFAFVLSLAMLRYGIPNLSRKVSGPYLDATLEASRADSMEVRRAVPGEKGVAKTFLRPSGKAKVGNEVFDVITEGEFIEKGTPVRITDIRGNRIIVARIESEFELHGK